MDIAAIHITKVVQVGEDSSCHLKDRVMAKSDLAVDNGSHKAIKDILDVL